MKCYAVAEIDITDPSWVSAYVENTTKLVEQHGGRYLEDRQLSMPASSTSRIWKAAENGSKGEFFLVAGEDVNNLAQM